MQFSLKWLLAGVAYVAVVCASVTYQTLAWVDALAAVGLTVAAAGLISFPFLRGGPRCFLVGFAAFWLLLYAIFFVEFKATAPLRESANRWAERIVGWTPTLEQVVREYWETNIRAGTEQFGTFRHVIELPDGSRQAAFYGGFGGSEVFPIPASVVAGRLTEADRTSLGRQHLLVVFGLFGGLTVAWLHRRHVPAKPKET